MSNGPYPYCILNSHDLPDGPIAGDVPSLIRMARLEKAVCSFGKIELQAHAVQKLQHLLTLHRGMEIEMGQRG